MEKTTKDQDFINELHQLEDEVGCEAASPSELENTKKKKKPSKPKRLARSKK